MEAFLNGLLGYEGLNLAHLAALLFFTDLLLMPSSIVCLYISLRYGFPAGVLVIFPVQTLSSATAYIIGRRFLGEAARAAISLPLPKRLMGRPMAQTIINAMGARRASSVAAALLVFPKGLVGYIAGASGGLDNVLAYLRPAAAALLINSTLKVLWQASAFGAILRGDPMLLALATIALASTIWLNRRARAALGDPPKEQSRQKNPPPPRP